MFSKILIANRGEIALRILRACKELGISTVAVHSTADADAMHVRLADESVCIGPPAARDSYLNIPAILEAARATGAGAVHPGYGFLSENADFAAAVEAAGLVFVGPEADAIARMGSKIEAKAAAEAAGVPVLPGYRGEDQSNEKLLDEARALGAPFLVKASAGGGGRGMRLVTDLQDAAEAIASARSEAKGAFGDAAVFLERYAPRARHIEVQVLGDSHGTALHLGDRDCSLQRNHQKLIEEAPAADLPEALRASRRASDNLPFQAMLGGVIEQVETGKGLADALRQARWFPPLMVYMVAAGERSGRLAEMFQRSAEHMEAEVDGAITVGLSLLEPGIIIAMAVIVVGIVLSILLPILQLNTAALG